MEVLHLIIQVLVYPGLIFTIIMIILTQWISRKLSARLQFRRGPVHAGPAGVLQPLADLLKLVSKRDLISKYSLVWSPPLVASLAIGFVIAVQLTLPVAYRPLHASFDLIVILYFLLIAPLALAYLALAHPNPYASIGAARYLALLAVSEPVFVATLFVPAIISSRFLGAEYSVYSIVGMASQAWLVSAPKTTAMLVASVVGFVAMLAVLSAKPFDSPEAESEIYWGIFTELGGPRLALGFFLKFAERVIYPLVYSGFFLGGASPIEASSWPFSALTLYLKALAVFTLITILDNTLPRYKPEQAVEFILKYLYPSAIVSLALALT